MKQRLNVLHVWALFVANAQAATSVFCWSALQAVRFEFKAAFFTLHSASFASAIRVASSHEAFVVS